MQNDKETRFKPVLLLEGARQVGKTTLAERVLQQSPKCAVHVNLERDALIRSVFDDCRDFAEYEDVLRDRFDFQGDADQVLFIDEAQESRKLGEFVRFMKEEWPKATVILSGSTLTRLFRPKARYPVGRVRRFILGPFSFSEFLLAHDKKHLSDLVLSELRESAVPFISAVNTLSAGARTTLGAVIENQTAIELARSGTALSGWKRTPSGVEIDFIVKRGDTALPVECKAALTVNRKHMRGIAGYLRLHGLRTGYLASLAPYFVTTMDEIRIVSLPAYLLERLGHSPDRR